MLRIFIELFLCLDKSICWLKKLLMPRWLLARKAANAPLARKTVNAPRGKLKIISEFTSLRSTQPIFKVTSYLGQYYTQQPKILIIPLLRTLVNHALFQPFSQNPNLCAYQVMGTNTEVAHIRSGIRSTSRKLLWFGLATIVLSITHISPPIYKLLKNETKREFNVILTKRIIVVYHQIYL